MIENAVDKVNKQIKAAGTICKVIGAFQIASGLFGVVLLMALRPVLQTVSEPPAPLVFSVLTYGMPAGLALGLAVMVSGIGLARLERWARALTEGLAWFFGVFIFGFAFFFAGALPPLPSPMGIFVVGFVVISVLVWLIPVGLAIRWLRKTAVRQAFNGERANS